MNPKKTRSDPAADEGEAFVPDVARTHETLADDEAEAFAEEFIATATSGEYVGEDARDEAVLDEIGGPFVEIVSEVEERASRPGGDAEPERAREKGR